MPTNSYNRKQANSFCRKKSSYAPIMLTSKSIKPVQRQDKINQNQRQTLKYYTKTGTNFRQASLSQAKNKQKIARFLRNAEISNQKQRGVSQDDRLNKTHDFIRFKHEHFIKTNQSANKRKILDFAFSESNIQTSQKLTQIDRLNNTSYQQLDPYQEYNFKNASASNIVKMEFNSENKDRSIRKNNSRYYAGQAGIGNTAPSTNRQYRSQSNKQPIIIDKIELQKEKIVEITTEQSFKLISYTQKPHHNLTQQYFKAPLKYLAGSGPDKKSPIDNVSFTNFKQKIYQKKLSKMAINKKSTEDWNQYLNKYYLNIKKVKPLVKFNEVGSGEQLQNETQNDLIARNFYNRESKSSADLGEIDKIDTATKKGESAKNEPKHPLDQYLEKAESRAEKIQRIRSSTLNASSKTTEVINALEETYHYQLSPQHKSSKPKACNPKFYNDAEQKKIEADIMTKRLSVNKNYFVFSMGDSSNPKNIDSTKQKFDCYKDFLWKVNYSNGLYVKLSDDVDRTYKFFVGRGNNSAIIKGIMRRRFWWQLVDKISEDTNFVWSQLRVNDFVKGQNKKKNDKLLNLLQIKNREFQTTHTSGNFQQDLEKSSAGFKQVTLLNKKVFRGSDLNLWISHYSIHKNTEQKFGDNILQKRLKSMVKRKKMKLIESSCDLKTHNHFQCNYFLGNKKALFYAMRRYYKLQNEDPFQYIPLTYHISGGLQDPEFGQFLQKYNQINQERRLDSNKDIRNIWIVKPGEITNRGNGITVCATLDEIKIRLRSKQKNSDGSLRTYILQKYIEKPLLYYKRKFDIRHYMLMSCINGQIKGYWYQQGYVRTTSTEYNIKNCKDLYTHLTNDAIQKNSSDYGKFQKGNKVSYQDFGKYVSKVSGKKIDFSVDVLIRMKKLGTDAIRATYNILEPNRRENNFELFGLDFMIDENFQVNLIECNTNPCLELSCPLLSKIISGLVENVFKICVDPLFPPPYDWPNSKKYQLGNEPPLIDQKFEIVFDETDDGSQLQRLYGFDKGLGSKIGKVEQQQEQYEDKQQEEEWVEQNIVT